MKYQGKVQRRPLFDISIAGPMFMLSAAFLFALTNILIKTLDSEYTSWHIAFYRFFGGMIILIALFGRHNNPFSGHNIRLLSIRGCVGAVNFIFLIRIIGLIQSHS